MRYFMPAFDRNVRDMFYKMGHIHTDHLHDADFIVFTGGADVSPEYYGEVDKYSYTDPSRDAYEKRVFDDAKKLGKKFVGICRGSQFLTVMAGGKLWQDIDRHATGAGHLVETTDNDKMLMVSSTHHQQMRPEGTNHVLLAWGRLSTTKRSATEVLETEYKRYHVDPEAVFYPDIQAVACQFHPEYFAINHKCPKYFFRILNKYLGINSGVESSEQ